MEGMMNHDELLLSPVEASIDTAMKDSAKKSDAWRKIEDYKMRKAFEADLEFFDELDDGIDDDILDDIFHS